MAKVAGFRVRTLTAGIRIETAREVGPIQDALAFLKKARQRVIDAGYEVQTTRVSIQPLLLDASAQARDAVLPQLVEIDRLVAAAGAVVSIGPVLEKGRGDDQLARWAADLIRATRAMSLSVAVATPEGGVNAQAARMSAEVIRSLAAALPGGVGNFRFAAAANIPAGTPFFPVARHEGEPSLSCGLETPNLVHEAFADVHDLSQARDRLRDVLNERLGPLETLFQSIAKEGRRKYLGIDSSPAPGADSSIGAAIETLTGVPFGSPATLQACATITEAIKSLRVQTCGYSGLMLPVLEDPVLAKRAVEGRYSVSELLLFSSVCGTGLDVVPLAGNASVEELTRVIGDMAMLAHRLKKPLSARLFPVPGKAVGDNVTFDDPLLFACKAMPLERAVQ